MRNRILQKTFWTSEEILELELYERLLFLGMTNYADDEGIIKTSPKALKAKIFPVDNIKITAIESSLLKMRELGLIKFNNDRTLCRFVSWHNHQKINRPYPSKFEFVEESSDDSMNIHGTLTHHSLPNSNNNSNNNNKNKEKNNDFLVWYDLYPRKIGKPKALSKFEIVIKDYPLEDIINGTKKWCDYWKNTHIENKFIPHPTTFLSQERFVDEPDEVETEAEYRLDSTGNFYVGYCASCNKTSFYKKEELNQDSKCCKSKILPSRELNEIQDVNAEA